MNPKLSKIIKFYAILFVAGFVFFGHAGFASAACLQTTSGTWSGGATFTGCNGAAAGAGGGTGLRPGSVDAYTASAGVTLTVDVATPSLVSFTSTAWANTTSTTIITINSGASLNVTGNFNLSAMTANSTETVSVAGTLDAGSVTYSSATASRNQTITVAGTLTVHGAVTITSATGTKTLATTGSAAIINLIGGSIPATNLTTTIVAGGTTALNSTGTSSLTAASANWGAVTVNSGSTFTVSGASTFASASVTGTLTLGGVATIISGTTSVASTGVLNTSSATGTKTFTGNVTVASGGKFDLSATGTIAAVSSFSGILTNNSSNVFRTGSGTAITTLNGTKTHGGTGTFEFGALTIAVGAVQVFNTSFAVDNNLVFTSGASNQSLTLGSSAVTMTVTGTTTINQPSSTSVTVLLDVDAGTFNATGSIALAGNTASEAKKLRIGTGTVNANGGITNGGTTGSSTINMAEGNGTLRVKGTVTTTGWIFTMGNFGSNFVYADTAAQTIAIPASGAYDNLVIMNTAGATLSTAITSSKVAGNIIVGDGSTAAILSTSVAITGGNTSTNQLFLVNNGSTFKMTSTANIPTLFGGGIVFNPSSTIEYDQSTAPTMTTGITYGNLSFKTASASKTFTLPASITVNGNLVVGGGGGTALVVTADTSDPTLVVGGNFTVADSSTFTASSSAALTVEGDTTVGGGTSGVFTEKGGAVNMWGNLTLASGSTFTPNSSTVLTFEGDGTQTVTDNNSTKQDLGKIQVSVNATNGYTYSRPIVIDHTKVPNSDQINFPVLISGTYTDLKTVGNGGKVQSSSGYDIIFTSDITGYNLLGWESEKYVASTGEIVDWVNVPDLSHVADTTIYMWYGNASTSSFQGGGTTAWNSNFKGVWHTGNGSTLSATDATGVNNGTVSGATATSSGLVYGGASFANGQYINIPTSTSLDSTVLTWSIWIKTSTTPGATESAIMSRRDATSSCNGIGMMEGTGFTEADYFGASCGGSGLGGAGVNHNPHDGSWHLLGTSAYGTSVKYFLDGAQVDGETLSNTFTFNGQPLRIGTAQDTFWPTYIGTADEFRVSNVLRYGDWFMTEYNNDTSPSTFYSVGSEVVTSTPATIVNMGSALKVTSLTIDALQTFSANGSNTLTLSGAGTGSSRPFVDNGIFTESTGTVTFAGTTSSDIAAETFNNLTIDRASGTPTFTLTGNVTVGGALNVNNGILSQGATFNLTTGAVTVGTGATWTNTGTGDVTLSGDVANFGTITLNSNNGTQCADGANDIVVISAPGGTQRNWAGSGTFNLYNLSVTDMTDSSIAVYNSSLSNTTWSVASCGTFSGTLYRADETTVVTTSPSVKLSINGGAATTVSANASGVFSFSNVTVATGNTVTIWISGATEKGSLVFRYGSSCTGTPDCTGLKIFRDNVIIGSYDGSAITNANISSCDDDTGTGCATTDIGFTSNSGNLSLDAPRVLRIKDSSAIFTPGGIVSAPSFNQSAGTVNGGASSWVLSGFTLSGGTYNSTSGTLQVFGGWTKSGGTFNHDSGSVLLGSSSGSPSTTINITGSTGFYDLYFTDGMGSDCCSSDDYEIGSSTILTINGTLYIDDSGGGAIPQVNGGSIYAKGDVSVSGQGMTGTTTVVFNKGTGTQTFTGAGANSYFPNVQIDDTSGTLVLSGTIDVSGNWTYTSGTLNAGTSTVDFKASDYSIGTAISGSQSLYNVIIEDGAGTDCCTSAPNTISGTLTVLGDFTLSDQATGQGGSLSGGTVDVKGNFTLTGNGFTGTTALTLSSTGSQTINTNGFSLPSGTFTINKSSGTATLGGDLVLTQAFNITAGTFDQGASYSLTSGAITVGASGVWSNTGTGDVTLSGNVSNAGSITLDGSGVGCGDADAIVLTSTNTSQRTWSGAGTFVLADLNISYMAGSITASSSTNSGNNTWTISGGCGSGITVSGNIVTITGLNTFGNFDCTSGNRTVSVRVNGAGTYTSDCTDSSGDYSISSITATTGDVITVFLDGETEKSVSVVKAIDSSTDLTVYLAVNGVGLGMDGSTSQTITNSDLDQYDSGCNSGTGDSDIPFCVNSGNLTVSDGVAMATVGDTFAPGGTVTLSPSSSSSSTDGDLYISPSTTLNMATNSLSVGGDFVNQGTFQKSGSQTTTFTATATGHSIVNSGSGDLNNVTFNGSGGSWSFVSSAIPVDGSLTISNGTLNGPSGDFVIDGNISISNGASYAKGTGGIILSGGTTQTITDSNSTNVDLGDITVSSSTASMGSSLKISNLQINSGQTFTSNGTKTLTLTGTTWTNNGTFTPSSGTVVVAPTGYGSVFTIAGSGATTFNNFTDTTPGSSLAFKASQDANFNGTFTVTGSGTDPISISSDTSSTKWKLNLSGTASLRFAKIQDSGCESGTGAVALNDTISNQGNNTTSCWLFIVRGGGGGGGGGDTGGGTVQSGGGNTGGSGGSDSGSSGGGTVQTGGGSGGGGGGASP